MDNRLGIGNQLPALAPSRIRLLENRPLYPAQFHFFLLIFLRNLSGRRRHFVWLSQYPGLCSGTARTEEFRSSKFGTRWYVNAAAAPLLQRFENYYGASH